MRRKEENKSVKGQNVKKGGTARNEAKNEKKIDLGVWLSPFMLIAGVVIGMLISKCPEDKKVVKKEPIKQYPVPVTPKIVVEGREITPREEKTEREFPKPQTVFFREVTRVYVQKATCYDFDFSPEFIMAPEKYWNKREVDIIFSPGITFYCIVQDYKFPCPVISAKMTIQFTEDGEKTFEVFFEDNDNCSRKLLEKKFIIDTYPPTTTIIPVGFSDFVTTPDVTFKFLTDEPVAFTLCRLDDGYWIDCSGGSISLMNVEDGWHTIWAYSVDLAGNEEKERKFHRFRVDAKPPVTLLISAPPRVTNVNYAEFVFETIEPDVRFECNLDDSGWVPCQSPFRISELKPGLHIIKIRGIDSMGRYEEEPVMYSWRVVEGKITGAIQPYEPPESVKKLLELREKQKEIEMRQRRRELEREKKKEKEEEKKTGGGGETKREGKMERENEMNEEEKNKEQGKTREGEQ